MLTKKQKSSVRSRTVVVEKLGSSGWYSFENVPQQTNDVKVHMVRCETANKAIDQAKRINPGCKYIIREVRE